MTVADRLRLGVPTPPPPLLNTLHRDDPNQDHDQINAPIIPSAAAVSPSRGLPPIARPIPHHDSSVPPFIPLPVRPQSIPFPATKRHASVRGNRHTDEDDDHDAFKHSCLVRAWQHRHQCAAMVVSLIFFLGGLAVALVLFLWFRGVHRSYYFTDLHRTCLSLGDSLALDISTNLVTFADDMAGYAATERNLNDNTMARFVSLAADHANEADGVSLVAVFARHRQQEWEQRFNTTLVDGNDTFTKLSLLAPITYRVIFPPLRTSLKNPIGFNMFSAGEYARSVRLTLGDGRPSLAVAEPNSTNLHPPWKRVWIAKGIRDGPVPNFPVWVITLLVDTQRSVSRTLAPSERTHGFHVRLVDNVTASELFVSQHPASSVLIPSDTAVTSFSVVDREWTLTCTGTHTLRGEFYTPWSWVLLSLLIVVFTVSAEIARRAMVRFLTSRGLARQVKHREGLVASLRMYSQAIVSTVRDPMMALDPFGYLVGSNKEALTRLGIHGSNTSSVHISSLLPPAFVNTVMAAPVSRTPTASPMIPRSVVDWDSVYSLTHDDGGASVAPPPMESLPPGSYEVGIVGRPSASFVAEATVSHPTTGKRGQVSQVLLLHDVTKRIRAMQALETAKDAAKAASVAKSQLLLLISHELRNPIYVIGTLVEDAALAASFRATRTGTLGGWAVDDLEYVALARIQHTTRLVADILSYLVDLFADSSVANATAIPHGTFPQRNPGMQLLALTSAALSTVQTQLDLWDITVEQWISPEWVMHGSTETLELVLVKVAYIIAHASRPGGQTVLEVVVDSRSRELRVYCRGDMWIPSEQSMQVSAASPPLGLWQPPAPDAFGEGVGYRSRAMMSEPTMAPLALRPPRRIPAPDYMDPLTHAALFLAMESVRAALVPINGTVLRCQFSQQYGGLDMTVPLGELRAARTMHLRNDLDDSLVPTRPSKSTIIVEEDVSLQSARTSPKKQQDAWWLPSSRPLDTPPRNVGVPSHLVYPSPISPDRMPTPLASATLQPQPRTTPPPSHATTDEEHTSIPCPVTATQSFLDNAHSFIPNPNSPSPAPRTKGALSARLPLSSDSGSRIATVSATRTPTSHSLSMQDPMQEQPSPPHFQRSMTSPVFPSAYPLVTCASPKTASPEPASLHAAPFDIPLPLSPVPSVQALPVGSAVYPDATSHAPIIPIPSAGMDLSVANGPALLQTITSPRQPSSDPTEAAQRIHPALPPASFDSLPPTEQQWHKPDPPKRILVVEDNALVLRVTSKLVKTLGFEADTAADGLECVKHMQDKSKPKVDLILMDLVMPNMDGHEAMKTLRDIGFSKDMLPIVAVTANALPEERDKCLEAGFNDFVAKPLKKVKLHELCHRFSLLN